MKTSSLYKAYCATFPEDMQHCCPKPNVFEDIINGLYNRGVSEEDATKYLLQMRDQVIALVENKSTKNETIEKATAIIDEIKNQYPES